MQSQSQLVPELERLQRLHASGFLTDTELAQAKAKLLGGAPTTALTVEEADAMLARVDRAEHRVEIAELQAELSLLDQDWEQERRRYVYRNRYGQTTEPSRWVAIGLGLVAVAVGIYLLMQPTGPGSSAFVGILFITLGPVAAFAAWGNAIAFERRKKLYLERRQRLRQKIEEMIQRK
jgi:hypothetical protein